MKNLIFFIIYIGIIQISSCIKPEPINNGNNQNSPFTNTLPKEYKDLFYFKKGSFWIYKNTHDDGSITYDSFYVKESTFEKRTLHEEKVGQVIYTELSTPYKGIDNSIYKYYTYYFSTENILKTGAMLANDTPFVQRFGLTGYNIDNRIEKSELYYIYGSNTSKGKTIESYSPDTFIYKGNYTVNGKLYHNVWQALDKGNYTQAERDSFGIFICPKIGIIRFGFKLFQSVEPPNNDQLTKLSLIKYHIEP